MVSKRIWLGDKGILEAFVNVALHILTISWRKLHATAKKLQNKNIFNIQNSRRHIVPQMVNSCCSVTSTKRETHDKTWVSQIDKLEKLIRILQSKFGWEKEKRHRAQDQ